MNVLDNRGIIGNSAPETEGMPKRAIDIPIGAAGLG